MELVDAVVAASRVRAIDIINELGRMAFSDVRDIVTWEGDAAVFKPSSELTDDQARAISEVYETVSPSGVRTLRVKMASKQQAIDSLAKILGVAVERRKTEHSGPGGGPIETKATGLTDAAADEIRRKILDGD